MGRKAYGPFFFRVRYNRALSTKSKSEKGTTGYDTANFGPLHL